MRNFRKYLKVLLVFIVLGIALYVGGWLLFCMPIIDIIEAIKAGWIAKDIAISLFKIFILLPILETLVYIIIVLISTSDI